MSATFAFLALALLAPPTLAQQQVRAEEKPMKIRLTAGAKVLTATLLDNATARDFAALLPMTLTLKDYASTEKVSDLPRRLSTKGAPSGATPSVGDIAYYAPWGNLAIYYKDFDYSSGLIKLGKLDGDVEALRAAGPIEVKVELAK
ncbi:cyclophilin-like fold protein [Pyxidicoccus sp. 3LFB2]